MNDILYDLLELLFCGINNTTLSEHLVIKYQLKKDDENNVSQRLFSLYQISKVHFVDALTGRVLKHAGVKLPTEWEESIAKSIRKELLFDVERIEILKYLEQNRIWYLPLKGIILKEYYPSVGMRQMSDNDILFDENYAEEVRDYMVSRGYIVKSFGQGNHDVYDKAPVYNFEMHRSLYGLSHDNNWECYYQDIKSRLISNRESEYGYHMTLEDFYVYIICHGYKHYKGNGTGIRTLLDFYVYLRANEQKMDFSYIEQECKKLGLFDFEKQSRMLCKKVFGMSENRESIYNVLSKDEKEMLNDYLVSGVYGTTEHGVHNRLKKYRGEAGQLLKIRYMLWRLFPGEEVYRYYPFVYGHKWCLPGFYIFRMFCMLFTKERRKRIFQECKILRKSE